MKVKVKTLKQREYKGHIIREVETEYGCVFTLIDNICDAVEQAPMLMHESEYEYASFADAKRAINGQPMVYVMGDAELIGDKYFKRFHG